MGIGIARANIQQHFWPLRHRRPRFGARRLGRAHFGFGRAWGRRACARAGRCRAARGQGKGPAPRQGLRQAGCVVSFLLPHFPKGIWAGQAGSPGRVRLCFGSIIPHARAYGKALRPVARRPGADTKLIHRAYSIKLAKAGPLRAAAGKTRKERRAARYEPHFDCRRRRGHLGG